MRPRALPRLLQAGAFVGQLARGVAQGVIAACALGPTFGWAGSGLLDDQSRTLETAAEARFGFREGSVVAAPIPFSNATIGTGLALGAGYMFTSAEGAKPSLIGIGALKSDNGTQAYGATLNYVAPDNRWLANVIFADAEIFYDLYLLGQAFPTRQTGQIARASLSFGPRPDLNFGALFRYIETSVRLNLPGGPLLPPELSDRAGFRLGAAGAQMEWDRRDDSVYPTRGHVLYSEAFFGFSLDGARYRYAKGYANLSKYWPLGGRGVIATRGALCMAAPETPFFDLCSIGGTDGFRGFSATQYLDQRMASVQIEYRHRLSERIGLAAFAGIGNVAGNFPHSDHTSPKRAGGVGVRYRISKQFGVDFAIDGTRNSLHQNQIYIYVGQRF